MLDARVRTFGESSASLYEYQRATFNGVKARIEAAPEEDRQVPVGAQAKARQRERMLSKRLRLSRRALEERRDGAPRLGAAGGSWAKPRTDHPQSQPRHIRIKYGAKPMTMAMTPPSVTKCDAVKVTEPYDPDPDRNWSVGVAAQYELDELEAMCTWLDVNLDLNQQRLESVTTRLGSVLALGAANLALMAATVDGDAWPLTLPAILVTLIAMWIAVQGQSTVSRPDRDPTTTWDTMWGPRKRGELQVLLYRRRSVLFADQRKVIEDRARALKESSWCLGFGIILAAAAILVSRL